MFKKTFQELKKRGEATMTESEYNSQKEIEEMEARLDPKPKHVFGNAIRTSTSYCDHPLGKFISREL